MAWLGGVIAASNGKKRPVTKADKFIAIFGIISMLFAVFIIIFVFIDEPFLFSGPGIVIWIPMISIVGTTLAIAFIPWEKSETKGMIRNAHQSRVPEKRINYSRSYYLHDEHCYSKEPFRSASKPFCRNCGMKLNSDDRYCYSCGWKIN
ncbi:MAG: zinc ribbon domain-containing protein [Candidatus Odinarchaeota archaeon]